MATTGDMSQRTYCLSEAARYLGFSRRTLYNMMKDGRFDAPPIPGMTPRRWNVETLDQWRGVGQ